MNSMKDYYRIGTLGIIALVALRVGVGWHFFKEGSEKIRTGTFSSEGFLKSSEGRLAGLFQSLVWDIDGSIRLDAENFKPHFEQVLGATKQKYQLSQEQIQTLDKYQKQFFTNLDEVYLQYEPEISKYQKSTARIEKMQKAAVWNEVSSLRGHQQKIEDDRMSEVRPALESIDALTKRFEQQVGSIVAGGQQSSGYSGYRLSRPGQHVLGSQTVDRILPVFDITVGILLMIGLLVPLASGLAAMFLIGVILSQFPGDPGTQPTYFQAVEALSLVLLGSLGAGRFAGLDFFTWTLKQNRKAARGGSVESR